MSGTIKFRDLVVDVNKHKSYVDLLNRLVQKGELVKKGDTYYDTEKHVKRLIRQSKILYWRLKLGI